MLLHKSRRAAALIYCIHNINGLFNIQIFRTILKMSIFSNIFAILLGVGTQTLIDCVIFVQQANQATKCDSKANQSKTAWKMSFQHRVWSVFDFGTLTDKLLE